MSGGTAADVAAVIGALGVALFLVPTRRAALVAGVVVLAAAEALLAYELVPASDVHRAVSSPARILAVALALVAFLAAGWALARFPAVVPVLVALVAPFRVQVHLGDQRAFLLVPLYAVLAATVVALLIRLARRETTVGLPQLLSVPAALFIGLSSLSLLWSHDVRAGTIELLFFLLPFAVLVGVVARSPLVVWTPRVLAITVVAVATGLGAVGLSQLWTRNLYFARDLEVANAYTSYFRTTSLFHDSSVYGQQLVIALLVLLTAMWLRRVALVLALALIAFLWVSLYFTYSQSSMVALAVAALGLGLLSADRRGKQALVATAVVLVAIVVATVSIAGSGHSARRVTSGRAELARGAARVFVHHPVVGVGIGAQPAVSRQLGGRRTTAKNVSHTAPLTVAAELGVVGILAYLALMAAAVVLLREALRRNRPLGLALGAVFLALFVQTLFYSGFFENPATWGVLALAGAVAMNGGRIPRLSMHALFSRGGSGTAPPPP